LFQIGWFACVLGGAKDYALTGTLVATAIILFHIIRAPKWHKELMIVFVAMFIGFIWDSYLVYQNWLGYPYGQLSMNTAPYWIVIMWGLFATTFNVSLNWLKDRPVIAVLFGAIGGPLAYYAGAKLGAVQFNDSSAGLIALAIGWAVLMPLLLLLSDNLNGFRTRTARTTQ
jgi:hypothetical protein